jgi:UDP-N-acetylmuramyl pentapeptide synthase
MSRAPFTGRKILIAGGVVELGDKTEEVHLKLGRQMSRVADKILLVDGPV